MTETRHLVEEGLCDMLARVTTQLHHDTTRTFSTSTPRVGVIGSGQLARMMFGPATELGIELRLLATDPADAASLVSKHVAVADPSDVEAVTQLASECDVVTFEHEHVPANSLDAAARCGDVQPTAAALVYAQDKLAMRKHLSERGYPCPSWSHTTSLEGVAAFCRDHGGKAVAKAPRGGYDGKGVAVVSEDDIDPVVAEWLERGPVLMEELVDYRRELSILVARRPSGQCVSWPVTESVQTNGVCDVVIAPAPQMSDERQQELAGLGQRIAEDLGVTGVLAVECFERQDGEVAINELAMRPHNSGHWTMAGSVTSQFEQHLRAVLDLPLGDTSMTSPACVMVNIFGADVDNLSSRLEAAMTCDPGAKIHLYGKDVRPGRKNGHVNVCDDDAMAAQRRARAVASLFMTQPAES